MNSKIKQVLVWSLLVAAAFAPVAAEAAEGPNIIYIVADDNIAVTSYERSLDGGTNWVDVGNVLTVNISGRVQNTTDQVRVRAKDAAGNVSTPALSTAVTLPAGADTTLPTLVGMITVTNLASTGYTLAWPAGTVGGPDRTANAPAAAAGITRMSYNYWL